jgi:DNA replication protein DnaC
LVRNKLSTTAWLNWVSPIKVKSEDENEIIIEIPNIFVQQYILSNFKELFEECMNGKNYKFEIGLLVKKEKPIFERESSEFKFMKSLCKKFQQASFVNSLYLAQDMIDFGKDWVCNPKSLIVQGDVGCGKTYFCFCLMREALKLENIQEAIYLDSTELDSNLLNAIQNDSEYKLLQKYKTAELLFIDDFGRERKTDRMFRQLYEIINYRYANEKITLISTNFDNAEIADTICPAIASRMCEWDIIEMKGPDLRRII